MSVQKLEERPPYVMFSTVSVEDREATIAAGHYVGKDVDMAFITPAGSKDRIERVVSEWFVKLGEDLASDRVPAVWVDAFKAQYRAFKEGSEAPTSGTAIINWPGLSPTVVKMLQSLHLLAIEDVAAANEETILRMGMGGRALKQRAIDYLAAANDVGKVAERASALQTQLDDQTARNKSLEERMSVMAMQLQALQNASQPFGMASQPRQAADQITAADLLDDGPGQKL